MGNFWTVIRDILGSPAGSFAFVAGILYLSGWVIAKISSVSTDWQARKAGIDKLENKVDSISTDLQFIKATLEVMQNFAPDSKKYTKSHSPVSLTPLGQDVAKRMNIEQRVAENWEKIWTLIDNSAIDKNAYDIQQFCIETARLNNFFITIPMTIFKKGEGSTGNYLSNHLILVRLPRRSVTKLVR